MHFRRGIIDGYAARFLLFLFFWIVRCEVRRDPFPGLAMVAGTEQELGANVDRSLFVGAQVNGGVPIEAQLLFAIPGLRLDVASLVRIAVHTANLPALGFGVDIGWIRGVFEHPE